MNTKTNFTEAVTVFTHGGRYERYLSLVRKGLNACDGDETAVFDHIMTNAPTPSPDPAKVRKAIRFAIEHPLQNNAFAPSRSHASMVSKEEAAERRRLLLPKTVLQFVPVTLRNYAATAAVAALAETIRMSEADFVATAGADIYRKQAALQLRALFRPGEKIWAGWIVQDEAVRKRLGIRYAKTPLFCPGDNFADPAVRAGIIEAHVLADRIEKGIIPKIPTHVSLQPVTGEGVKVEGGNGTHLSFDCAATIADRRHVLVEWDCLFDLGADGVKIPSQAHIEIVAGLLGYSFDHTDLIRTACAVYTGGKSCHVALRVKADDRAAYKRQTDALADLFASSDDPTFRADTTGWNCGYTHLRLAGAVRPETGRIQRLLWTAGDF